MDLGELTSNIDSAAKSPLALAAYVVVAATWALKIWLADKPEREARQILGTFTTDAERVSALTALLGQQIPPNLDGDQTLAWVKVQTRSRSTGLLLAAYLATLLAGVVVVGMAFYRSATTDPRNSPPTLLDTQIERGRGQ